MGWIHNKRALVLFKAEAIPGTDAVPTPAANAVLCSSVSMQPAFSEIDLERRRDTFAAPGKAVGKIHWDIEIEVPISGPAAPPVADLLPPECDALMQCAGWAPVDSGTPVDRRTYSRDSHAAQVTGTLYVYVYEDGGSVELRKATYCVFNREVMLSSGGEAVIKFSGKGIYHLPTNPVAPAAPTFVSPSDTTVDRGATILVAGRTDCMDDVVISDNSEVVAISCKTATYGYGGFRLDYGQPEISIDPTMVLTSTDDKSTEVLDQTLLVASFEVQTVQGAVWHFDAPNCQRGAFTYDMDKDVVRTSGKLYPRDTDAGSGDDALTFYVERA